MKSDKKIVALILARGGSKRIPQKNIRLLGGKPLVAYAIEAARAARCISAVYVSTDSAEIAEVSRKYGATVIERPAELATDTASSESALLHFAGIINFDILVFLQCTTPFTLSSDIDNAIQSFFEKGHDSMITAHNEHSFLWNEDGHSLNYDYTNRPRSQDRKREFKETGAFYIMTNDGLRTSKNRLHGRIGLCIIPKIRSIEIDTEEDFEMAELALQFLKTKNHFLF